MTKEEDYKYFRIQILQGVYTNMLPNPVLNESLTYEEKEKRLVRYRAEGERLDKMLQRDAEEFAINWFTGEALTKERITKIYNEMYRIYHGIEAWRIITEFSNLLDLLVDLGFIESRVS